MTSVFDADHHHHHHTAELIIIVSVAVPCLVFICRPVELIKNHPEELRA